MIISSHHGLTDSLDINTLCNTQMGLSYLLYLTLIKLYTVHHCFSGSQVYVQLKQMPGWDFKC